MVGGVPEAPCRKEPVKTIRLNDPVDLEIPCTCVVCGEGADLWVDYTHDSMPVVAGVAAFWSETEQRIPYCHEHAEAFGTRFRRLKWFQALLVVPGFLLVIAGALCFSDHEMFEVLRVLLGMTQSNSAGMILVATGLGSMGIAGISLLVKPFLYDAVIVNRGADVVAKARSAKFIEDLAATGRPRR